MQKLILTVLKIHLFENSDLEFLFTFLAVSASQDSSAEKKLITFEKSPHSLKSRD